MFNKNIILILITTVVAGCATVPQVPMESNEESLAKKRFNKPSKGNSGLYIYRSTGAGKLKVMVDGECIGKTLPKVFFYKEVAGDQIHEISTESIISPNKLTLKTKSGINYFIRQYKGVDPLFYYADYLELVNEKIGKKYVAKLNLAKDISKLDKNAQQLVCE